MMDAAASVPLQVAGSPASLAGGTKADGVAWRRVLQEAEHARWFLGASAVGLSMRADGCPWRRAAELVQRSVLAGAVAPAPTDAGPRPATPSPATEVQLGYAAPVAPWTGALGRSGPQVAIAAGHASAEPCADGPVAECSPIERARPQRAQQPTLRFHLETTQNGVAVWLGIEGSADVVAARTAALLEEIRRQSSQAGLRLATVVCNGAIAYAASAYEEKP